MAKFGEGDKRWIVADRADGTNVHNWHWAETNCLEWSRTFFRKLFANVVVADGDVSVTVKKVEKLDGEAYVNVRKGKVIPGYEIGVTLALESEVRGSNGKLLQKVDGAVEIPYISDENAGEDPEVRVTVKDSGEVGKRLKQVVVEKVKPVILEKVRVWVESMAKGGPVKDDLEAKKVVSQKNTSSINSNGNVNINGNNGNDSKKNEKSEGKKGFKTINLTERFNCRAKDLFEILMDENRWRGFTHSNAKISKEVGGEFCIFDGSVTGVNLELQEGKLIVQRWRFGSWLDGIQSTVRIVFEEPDSGVTVVKLTHSDVPEEDRYGNATVVENTERGWRDLIFQRIRAMFSFGI
ncbi:activator of 90 kDa heat shock protein ATPase homolog [Vigna radiata var. radiata]|uniref:Activator of 90 kDa heat shock protein ATPase homolog n=1 Tax=Vigna radiata var. radiata TaxID=3916 RepID=A0A1S3UYJ0_VIGRR|nr:activator of 90 kDa heat shock protein ATPase homolog [Vigna radiata var. radiata]